MDQDHTTPPQRSRRTAPRWMKWTLALSLGLNLIIIGVVAGATAKHHRGGVQEMGAMTMRYALRNMSDESRAVAQETISANRGAMKQARQARREAQRKLAAAISAAPYTPENVDAAFDEMDAASAERRRVLHENFTAILNAMTEEERSEAAKKLKKWSKWRDR